MRIDEANPAGLRRIGPTAYWLTGVLTASLALFLATAGQPFHLDNLDFPAVAAATAESGLPVYYRGEQSPDHLGLFHPPLYIYSLAAWIGVLGFGETQVRLFGFGCLIVQAWIVYEIVKTLLGTQAARRMLVWFIPLLLLNPYTLQTASIADIDSTIYGPILTGTVLSVLRLGWRNGERMVDPPKPGALGVVALLIALALWAKLTTVLLLLAFLPLFIWRVLGWRRGSVAAAGVIVGGSMVFGFTYWIYGLVTGLDTGFTLRFTLFSLLERGSSGGSGLSARLGDSLSNLGSSWSYLQRWTAWLPWLFSGVALAVWVIKGRRDPESPGIEIGLVLGLGLLTTLYYCAQTTSFGAAPFKYPFPYWPLVVASPVFLIPSMPHTSWSPQPRGVVAFGAATVGAVVGGLLLGDRLILNPGIDSAWLWVWLTPVFVAGVCVAALKWARNLVVPLLVASLGLYGGLALGVALYQTQVEYSTTYDYGQVGLAEAADFIRDRTTSGQVIVSMKDLGFRAERRYFENYSAIHGDEQDMEMIREGIEAGTFEYVVFTEDRGQDQLQMNPLLNEYVLAGTRLVKTIGNYRIYRPTILDGPSGR